MPHEKESDQLPEEQPGHAAPDDDGETGTRSEARENAGGADSDSDEREGQNTGNPANAG